MAYGLTKGPTGVTTVVSSGQGGTLELGRGQGRPGLSPLLKVHLTSGPSLHRKTDEEKMDLLGKFKLNLAGPWGPKHPSMGKWFFPGTPLASAQKSPVTSLCPQP